MISKIKHSQSAVTSAISSQAKDTRETSSKVENVPGPKLIKKKDSPLQTSPHHPVLPQLSAFQKGLTIFSCNDLSIAGDVSNTITQLAVRSSKQLGIPMPKVDAVMSLLSGNTRKIEQAKLLHGMNPSSVTAVPHEFKVIASRDGFDWCSNEGLSTLLPLIESAANKWLILEQQVVGPVSPILANGLSRISAAAKQAGAWVMVIVVSANGCQNAPLHQLCDEYIEVTKCEPYPGCYTAFAFDCVNIRDLNPIGVGKTMCSVKLKDGVLRRDFEPFVSQELLTRAIWTLRGQRQTIVEIAKLVGLHKSNVSRRLAGLPQPHSTNIHAEWLEEYLEAIKGGHEVSSMGDPAP